MKLAVLVSSYDRSASPFRALDPDLDPAIWVQEHQWKRFLIDKATAVRQVRDLARQGFDAFVCLCDGMREEDRAGVEVVVELERLGMAYTGANLHFFEPSRLSMKLSCADVVVETPRYAFAASEADAIRANEHLRFPLLVKHPNGYGSLGLGAADRVEHPAELRSRVALKIDEFGGALIEEFIEGREFSVLVAEPAEGEQDPRVWVPIEMIFPPGETFHHFDLKWKNYQWISTVPVTDLALSQRLQHSARRIFLGLKGAGYARVDLRMDREGRIFVLDINPNPSVFYPPDKQGPVDFILSYSQGGHREFLTHILELAFARRERLKPRWRLEFRPQTGYGIVAARNLQQGERIVALEETARRFVTKQYVEQHWQDWEKEVFRQSAVPFSDNVFRIWNAHPDEWYPYNHSCEPNAVFEGLDIVAWRPIAEDEPITLEYATYCGPFMAEFTCHCGAPTCRGTIRGTDAFVPWLEERYEGHITDYVRMIRARAGIGRNRTNDGFGASAPSPGFLEVAKLPHESKDIRSDSPISVRPVPGKDRGIFATGFLAQGAIIETCPVLIVPEMERAHLDKTHLYDYYFDWGVDGQEAAIALGYGSLYNHSYQPNAHFVKHSDQRTIEFVALRDIATGEEITVNYNGEPESREPLWFNPTI